MDTSGDYRHLQALYLPIAAGVVVAVLVLVVFAALRWRDRGDGRTPSRRAGAPRLEAAYAIVLALVAALLVGATFRTEGRVDALTHHPRLEIRVTAAKWHWRFDYADLHVGIIGTDRVPPTLRVPSDTPVRFTLRADDVIHSFWIPAMRFKRDAFPLRTTRFDLRFPHTGFLEGGGACAAYCGLYHGDMRFGVEVLSPRDFAGWVRATAASGGRG